MWRRAVRVASARYRPARAQRQLGFLTLDDLGIGPLLQRLGIVAGAFNRFVPPDAVQCLRRARTDGMNLLVIVDRELARDIEIDLRNATTHRSMAIGSTRPACDRATARRPTIPRIRPRLCADAVTTGVRRRIDSANGDVAKRLQLPERLRSTDSRRPGRW